MKTTTGREVRREEAERERHYRERGWWPGVPLAERFERFVREGPDALAVVDDRGQCLSREQLWREAGRLGAELGGQGIGPGDVVFIPPGMAHGFRDFADAGSITYLNIHFPWIR